MEGTGEKKAVVWGESSGRNVLGADCIKRGGSHITSDEQISGDGFDLPVWSAQP
jgi:hypothetical protein